MAWPGPAGPVVLDPVPVRLDPAEVRAFHGYKPLRPRPPAELAARLEAARRAVAAVMQPRLGYRRLGVVATEADRLVLEEGGAFLIPGIRAHWGPVDAVVAGLATVGPAPEALAAARLRAGDPDGAAYLDSAASAAVECVAEWANDHLCQRGVAAGLRVTNRISPGLAGWALADHARLVALCPAAAIGVECLPDGAVFPAKTVSFLVGAGPAARVDHYFVQCRRCWAPACPARRASAGGSVHQEA